MQSLRCRQIEEMWHNTFTYPSAPHARRHGPHGYHDYQSYKPWLRDDFAFRCVFCLVRERWCHDGANGFGVDHLLPQSVRPDLTCVYGNLLYVCNRCNCAKRVSIVLDPCAHALAEHLQAESDGTIRALTRDGQHIIDAFNLNYSTTREYRRRKIESFYRWHSAGDELSITGELAFPVDLPRLDTLRCQNALPDGVLSSFYSLHERGELPPTY
jgi:hypothetical protein